MITVEAIFAVCTSIVTFAFAELSKRLKFVQSDYIPLQNLTVGFLAGLFVWLAGINESLFTSMAICILSAFGAGGYYDLSQTGGKKNG